MAKNTLKVDLKSALRRKAQQRVKYSSLSVAQKLELMDQLHDNAAFLKSLRPKAQSSRTK